MTPTTKPLIGVSTYWDEARWGVWAGRAALLAAGYPLLVRRAGGLTAMLPPDTPEAAAEVVARIDGLVVAGGPDVAPGRYGAEPGEHTGPPAPERDVWELALIEAALERGTPLLGICRGMQLLNVALGGTLVQHLPDVVGHSGHAERVGVMGTHPVRTVEGTLLGSVLPGGAAVPTYHHQAVERLGRELRVSAFADDGTVEAVEHTRLPFALGVQWHPEEGDDPRVMRALVEAAAMGVAGAVGAHGAG
ncbi:gamma-glutamyl-gamma-aminobutyrate hydrolase family protein [Streptomyces capparidis]